MNMKSQPIEINKGERLLLVNLNKSFDQSKAEGVYKRSEPLEAIRKYWYLSKKELTKQTLSLVYIKVLSRLY